MTTIKKGAWKVSKKFVFLAGVMVLFLGRLFVPSSYTVTDLRADISDVFDVKEANALAPSAHLGDGDGGCSGCGSGCGSDAGCCP